MTSLRIFLTSMAVAAAVFFVGVRYGSGVSHRLPPQLALSAPSEHAAEPDQDGPDHIVERTSFQETPGFDDPFNQQDVPKPLSGIDLDGRLHRLGESESCRGIVLVFIGTQCPIANASLPKLNELATTCDKHNVEFFGVISNPSVTRVEAKAHSAEYGVKFPVLFDVTYELRARFAATHSPHAFVLSPAGDLLYGGAIDDQHPAVGKRSLRARNDYLSNAIADVVAGRAVRLNETQPVGCLLEKVPTDQQPTFAREIAPLVFAHCTTCHREGAVAPFPLITLDDVKRHAAQIRQMVQLKEMPPWRPVRGHGHFRDELVLTQTQIDLITEWIDAGTPAGDRAELQPKPEFKNGWQLGEPDLVVDVPEAFPVPADGPDIYQYFVLPTNLPDDRLVASIEYRAGNPRVVHHASFRYDDAGQARMLDEQFPGPGYQRFGGWGFLTGGTLGGWAVGVLPQRFPAGYGRPIKANSDLVLQTHYHPSGKPELDQAKVGIHFAPKSARRRIGELFVANLKLNIPPQASQHVQHAEYQLPMAVTIHSVLPHTHLLGRQTTAEALLPDGTTVPLIRIDDWRFNWQGQYFFKQPLQLPAGTRISFDVVFDNSDANPSNPHSPPQWVQWGEETSQEMAVCFFDVSTADDDQLDVLIRHNRAYIERQQ